MPNGEIQDEHINSFKKIGLWVKENGETIYGTRKGPSEPNDQFVTTKKQNKIYIHVLDSSIESLEIKFLLKKSKALYILIRKRKLNMLISIIN